MTTDELLAEGDDAVTVLGPRMKDGEFASDDDNDDNDDGDSDL